MSAACRKARWRPSPPGSTRAACSSASPARAWPAAPTTSCPRPCVPATARSAAACPGSSRSRWPALRTLPPSPASTCRPTSPSTGRCWPSPAPILPTAPGLRWPTARRWSPPRRADAARWSSSMSPPTPAGRTCRSPAPSSPCCGGSWRSPPHPALVETVPARLRPPAPCRSRRRCCCRLCACSTGAAVSARRRPPPCPSPPARATSRRAAAIRRAFTAATTHSAPSTSSPPSIRSCRSTSLRSRVQRRSHAIPRRRQRTCARCSSSPRCCCSSPMPSR